MNISIDTFVTFDLFKDRGQVTLDALELEETITSLFDNHGETKPKLDSEGKPILKADGQPETYRELDWKFVDENFAAWVKTQTTIDLKKSEVRGVWACAPGIWAKKNKNWRDPAPDSPASPTSPPSTDPRFSD